MGTFLQVTEYGGRHEAAFRMVRDIFDQVEQQCSRFLKESSLSLINEAAGRHPVTVPEECLAVIRAALEEADFTGGIFDPTVGALTSLWALGTDAEAIPDEMSRRKAAALVDYRKVRIQGRSVFLEEKGMKLDLGGAAKEYALHRAAREAERLGMTAGIIDAGGDLCTIGEKSDGSMWRIGIQHPRRHHTLLASVALRRWDTAETSGDYRRYILKDGLFQSHIFQPDRSDCGAPLISATLLYRRGGERLPLSGAACIAAGLDKTRTFLERLPGVDAILVTRDMKVFVTEGLSDSIQILDEKAERRALILHRKVI